MFKSLFLLGVIFALSIYIPRFLAHENTPKNIRTEWNIIMVSDMDKKSKEPEKGHWFSHIQVRFFLFDLFFLTKLHPINHKY
jgi:hypothetical protein